MGHVQGAAGTNRNIGFGLRKLDYFVKDEFSEAVDVYEKSMDELSELLAKTDEPFSVQRTDPEETVSNHESYNCRFALPRMKIPPFDDELVKWESFRDSFEALINSNALSEVQKLYFLKSFLEGDAALLIVHVQMSDTNYEGAWKILKDEYDCSRTLITAYINAFAAFPVMKIESARNLSV